MTRPLVVWLAGMRWDGHEGTDVRLARALGRHVDVLWFDPVASWMVARRGLRARTGCTSVAPGVTRVRTVGFPGVTRPVVCAIAQRRLWAAVSGQLRAHGRPAAAVVLSDPTGAFPRLPDAARALFVTDDWPAGSAMMGVARERLERLERHNAHAATSVVAISPRLADNLATRTGVPVAVVANGCEPGTGRTPPTSVAAPFPRAGLVGTVNERLDLDSLEAVADSGVHLVVVGPLTARSEDFRARFDALQRRPNVWWEGACDPAEVPGYLAAVGVGLTPYADNAFNRASFPLKTLEYLAAGLRVVSSPLPANDWLSTDLVEQASSPGEFAAAVLRALRTPPDTVETRRRVAFARGHSWDARARQLLDLVGRSGPGEARRLSASAERCG